MFRNLLISTSRAVNRQRNVTRIVGGHPGILAEPTTRSVSSSSRGNHRNNEYAHRPPRRFSSGLLIWASSLIVGGLFIAKLARENPPVLLDPFPTVHAFSISDKRKDDDDDEDLPPSKRFNFVANVVEKISPTVVSIRVQGTGFFGETSHGSGFFVTTDGLVVTNAHVVANSRRVLVTTFDGQNLPGRVVFKDDVRDLAIVQVDENSRPRSGFPSLPFAKYADTRPGEFVVAMGSPFTLSNTITSGIISSTARKGTELGLNTDVEYIQTDAPINFGNSGGPLVNLDGALVGVNTMKVTAGISFAIPSDQVQKFIDSYQAHRKTSPPGKVAGGESVKKYIGVTMLTLTPPIIRDLAARRFLEPSTDHGVLIVKVNIPSPAHRDGLMPGDVILTINGKPARSTKDVYDALTSSSSLKCEILRANSRLKLIVDPDESSF